MTGITLTLIAAALIQAEVTSPTGGPFLSIEYRVVEEGTDNPADSLEPGLTYDVLMTVRADQREGVKLNQLFKSQLLKIDLKQADSESGKSQTVPKDQYVGKTWAARSARVDAKTGTANFKIGLVKNSKFDGQNIWLKLSADVVLCDKNDTWCAKIREVAVAAMPGGTVKLTPLPVGFNAPTDKRVVLKVGDEAPDFSAPPSEGKTLRLSSFRGKKNVVLLFSRAHW